MLSLSKTTEKDVLLAHIYPNAESTTPTAPIFYTPKFQGPPALETDDVGMLLKYERTRILSEFGLTVEEYDSLVDMIRKAQEIDHDANRLIKRAFLKMRILVETKLKKEIAFELADEAYLRLNYDTREERTNYIVGVFGASGSGKSYSVCQLLLRDPAFNEYERVVLVGSVGEEDPSYEPLRDKAWERFTFLNTRDVKPEDLVVRNYAKCALVFDDIDSEADRKVRKQIQHFRDRCLQTARHYSIRVINTAHLFNSYRETAKIRNSARYLFILPRSIPHTLIQILEKSYNYKKAHALHLTNICKRDGRLTIISKNAPSFLMTPKRLILL